MQGTQVQFLVRELRFPHSVEQLSLHATVKTQCSQKKERERERNLNTDKHTGKAIWKMPSRSQEERPGTDASSQPCGHTLSHSVLSDSLDPSDCTLQASPSMEFSRQEYWSVFAVWLRELKPGLCDNLEGEVGGGGKEVQEGRDTRIPMVDSCWCMSEINTIL